MPDRGMIGRIIDHYRIELMLGQGGMAAVYKATDLQLEREVAIKVMHPHLASQASFQQRFLQEARAAARLDHPNIVRVFSFDSTGDDLFIVMELALGGNLRQYMKRLQEDSRLMDYQEAIELMRQLSEALDYAHQQGMIHRDIKPDNVLLKPDDGGLRLNYRPILTDFGLARLTTGENAITDQQPIGTYPYMSPEQSMADELDARSDIYSLGIMLYEVSAGKLPYNPKTIFEAARMHRHDALTLPSAVRPNFPSELEAIIIRALSKNRDDRYNTAGEVAQALQALLKPVQTPVRVTTPAAPPPPPRRQPLPPVDDGIPTDLTTVVMNEQLPLDIPPFSSPPWDDEPQYDRLLFYNPLNPPLTFDVHKPILTVGRDATRDIVLAGEHVSRRHMQIERKPNGRYTITDLNSVNGVWVGNKRLTSGTPVILNPGATVRMGDYWMLLQSRPEAQPAGEAQPETDLSAALPPADVLPVVVPVTEEAAPPAGQSPAPPAPETETMPPIPTVPSISKPSAPKADTADDLDILFKPKPSKPPVPANTDQNLIDQRVDKLEDVLDVFVGEAGGDVENVTQPISETALQREMPRHTPPHLTADQFGYDRLIFYSENNPTVTARLDKDHMSVGRSRKQDIVLPGRSVSRRHARIDLAADGKRYIVDLNSTSGLWADNQKLEPNTSVRLDPERIIRIGDYWMQYELKRDLPIGLTPLEAGEIDLEADPNQTAVMVKPLAEDMPHYSPPPMSVDMRAHDRIVFFSEDRPMQIIKLEREVLTVGRGEDQDVKLEGKRVSRQHARIEIKTDGNLYVTDQNSANGIWMGDTLLVPNTPVLWDTHEIIRLGNYWLKFEQGSRDFDPFGEAANQDEKWGRIGKKFKNYRVDRFIGQSDIAAVYKATQLPLNRAVALKFLHPKLAAEETQKQRFLREARLLSKLDHPNIIKVNAADSSDNELFMVMEFITQGSLRNYMNKFDHDRRMEYSEAVGLIIQIADGLHYAHQQGLIHRDMTPESIVLREISRIGPVVKYQPILTDFAVAQASESGEIYATDKPQVNYPYMSPEQCLGDRVDLRSDIYELGVVLYEMLTGQPPYKPRSIAEAIRMHAREPLPHPTDLQSDIPDDLEKVVLRALEKNPNNRYQTAAELARTLRRTNLAVVAEDGLVGAGAPGVVVDNLRTVVMYAQPKVMPMPTRVPLAGESREYDQLVLYSEDQQTRVIELKQDVMTIGRDSDQDIVLNSDKVSRRHARLERGLGGIYRITDVNSRNGSWLGSYKLVANVAETWDTGETVRLGDYWLRIEPAYDADAAVSPDADEPAPAPEIEVPVRPAVPIITADQEKIGVIVNMPHVRVAPGSSITVPVEVINRSDVVDHFRVEAIGLPSRWVMQPTEPLYLLPHTRDTTSITFHPPLESNSAAGAHAYEIRVSARAQNMSSTASQGSMTIEPFYGFVTELQPERIRNTGRTELSITNTGNSHETYSIVARDREQAVGFDLDGKQYVLPPGYTEYISIRVRPKKRPLIGAAHTYPFEILVSPVPSDKGVAPRGENGEVVAVARLRAWMLGGCLLLLLLIGLIAAVILLSIINTNNQNQTATVVAMVTSQSVDATATALADTDGDGLTNAKEAELGTDPNNPDTDGDGLTDREEVQVWQTNPLNRDTDGDTLTDGDEVRLGLNPLNRDTDGDGLPDNVDINPLALPTGTTTPQPTIPGTSGDICPGSPAPSVMKVGIQGAVTAGGVANRVRDNPGKKEGQIIGYMPPGTTFVVIDGPVCDPEDNLRWWKVNSNGLIGWTAEGEKDEFYLAPVEATPPVASAAESTDGSISSPPLVVAQLDPGRMGVQVDWNVDESGWNQLIDMVKPMQVGWVKVQASWRGLEPEQGKLGGDTGKLQSYLKTAHAQGYHVMVSIAKAPDWARLTDKSGDGPPDDPEDIARFLALLLAQMGSDIDAIEVWNEPNLNAEWAGALPMSGAGYMQLFQAAYTAIRAYSKSIAIVTAGLAPTINTAGSVNDRVFLRQMYQKGLADLKDVAVGIHPYSWGNPPDQRCCNKVDGRGWDDKPQLFFLNTLDTYRGIMVENGHGGASLWVTEFGWASWDGYSSSAPDEWMTYNTPDNQAVYALKAFGIGQALKYVGPMFLWNMNFANPTTIAGQNQVAGYSLLVMDTPIHPRSMYDSFIRQRQ